MIDSIDLNDILEQTLDVWKELNHANLFLTGGTGFFGHWLLDSFVYAHRQLKLKTTITVLSRNPDSFQKIRPDLFDYPALQFLKGDVRDFEFPKDKYYSHIIHAATEASAKLNQEDPLLMMDVILEGTKNILNFAQKIKTQKILFVSSGAVYGKPPFDLSRIPETYSGSPQVEDLTAAYGIAKRTAEHRCIQFGHQTNIDVKIARCFAFVGGYLPLDTHFAIGNFINDALNEKDICLKGDGTAVRSYLYASELAIWLWRILCFGKSSYPYNVGSDEAVSMLELAELVSKCFDKKMNVQRNISAGISAPGLSSRYVPDITRAKTELGLPHRIDLKTAILKTKKFYENWGIKDDHDKTQ